MSNIKTVYVEGNVGSGKSTFLSLLKDHLDVQIIYEPVELWQNIDGHNLLEQFFLDQRRWAFTLQSYVATTRIDQLLDAAMYNHNRVACIERSVFSSRYCFAQNLFDIGKMSDLEWVLYQKLWDRDVRDDIAKPAGFIYLRTPAEICFKRIEHRGRQEEHPLSLEYLKQLEKKHDDWLLHGLIDHKKLLHVPVLVLDNSKDIIADVVLQQKHIQSVKNFIEQL